MPDEETEIKALRILVEELQKENTRLTNILKDFGIKLDIGEGKNWEDLITQIDKK